MRPASIALVLLAALVGLAPSSASADDWDDPAADPGYPSEAVCELSYTGEDHSDESARGFTFDGVAFTASILSRVDFKDASLRCLADDGGLTCDGRCVDFWSATLDGARFENADATSARFADAHAPGASFGNAVLGGASFAGADVSATIWDRADAGETLEVGGADFGQALLSGARGRSDEGATRFAGANFRSATLLRVDFGSTAGRERTDFSGADLRQTRSDCRYTEVEVEEGTTETMVEVTECPDFTFADFRGAVFRDAIWRGADLGGALFGAPDPMDPIADLFGARFEAVDLTGGGIAATDLSNVDLSGTSLRDAVFFSEDAATPGTWVEAELADATLAGGDLSGAVLCHPLELVDVDEDGHACDDTPTECVDWSDTADPGDPENVNSLARTALVGAWAPGIVLADFDLRESDLRLADFACADLQDADVGGAAIDGADFGLSTLSAAGANAATFSGAAGACIRPAAEGDELPDPRCPRFDGASARGVSFVSAILDGATFVGADLQAADLSSVLSECAPFEVDPDLNDGLDERRFCMDFTGATLGRPVVNGGDATPFTLEGGFLDAPVFESVVADRIVLRDVVTQCRDGELPGPDGGDPVSHRFCPRFEDATITRAVFDDAFFDEAVFGCLDDYDGTGDFPCTDLRGASFDGFQARGSTWSGPIVFTSGELVEQPPEFLIGDDTVLSNADLSDATITCQGFTWNAGTEEAPLIQATQGCPSFRMAVLTPGLELAGATLMGIDFSGRDLTGVDLSGASFECFEFAYQDENDVEQKLTEICTRLDGATLVDANLSGADISTLSFDGVELTGADLSNVDLSGIDFSGLAQDENGDEWPAMRGLMSGVKLVDATTDADTRFANDYDPGSATGDDIKDDCTTSLHAGIDLRGADLSGLDVREVVDFGGDCIIVNKSTIYSEETQGLTRILKGKMTLYPVPEPSGAVASLAALGCVGWLTRRSRRRSG